MSKFDAELVISHLEKSCTGDNDVDLREYIEAYRELNKLFLLLGKIFAFVESDVRDKEQILDDYCCEDSEHYSTVSAMTAWEIKDGLPPKKQGSRTLLRLHRALHFLCDFLKALKDAPIDAQLSAMCRTSYERTLSKHHTWLVRKGVQLASYTLGSRQSFVRAIAAQNNIIDPTMEQINSTIERLITSSIVVYDRIQSIYQEQDLLNLP